MNPLLIGYLVGLAVMLVATRGSKYEPEANMGLGDRLLMALLWPLFAVIALPFGLLLSIWVFAGKGDKDEE